MEMSILLELHIKNRHKSTNLNPKTSTSLLKKYKNKKVGEKMRNIKFRGKSNDEWVYGLLLKSDKDDRYKYLIQSDHEKCKSCGKELVKYFITNEKTIGQFTGLNDKTEKEIYEGDIIKCSFYPDFIFEIKFTELCWYMRKIPTSEHIKLSDVLYEDLEVIGNIYDNKN